MLFRLDDLDHTFQVMNDLHRRLDRALGAAGLTDVPRASELGWVDLTETPDELVLRADLPGVDADALDISLKEEVLTLTAERRVEVPEGHKVHVRERRPYKFTRSFALPTRVDPEKVGARLRDGVLTVRLAKAEAVKPRQITLAD